MNKHYKAWTDSDIKTLRELYPHNPAKEVANLLQRSVPSVEHKASELGVRKSNRTTQMLRWTPNDIDALKKLYPYRPVQEIAQKLQRTAAATQRKAALLNLKKVERAIPPNAWTPSDIATLRNLHQTHLIREIAEVLGRTYEATERMSGILGLQKNANRCVWSLEDDRYLRKMYKTRSIQKIAELMDRPAGAVLQRFRKLKLDAIGWESTNGKIPANHVLVVVDSRLPRSPDNYLLVRKEDVCYAISMKHICPEISELRILERQIRREAGRLNAE